MNKPFDNLAHLSSKTTKELNALLGYWTAAIIRDKESGGVRGRVSSIAVNQIATIKSLIAARIGKRKEHV